MTGKLIQEPPLLVLPSLAKELGVTDAIIAQQLYYAGQRQADGWVERSFPDWQRALRGVFSARTIERAFSKLLEKGWIEQDARPGMVGRWRITPDKMTGDPRQEVPTDCRGSVSREEKREGDPPKKVPRPEPDGFADWLGFHHELTGSAVPREGTARRERLAGIFRELAAAGAELEDFQLESEGVFASPHMVEGGHLEPENVLRKTRFGSYADKGRRARDARLNGVAAKYAHLDG